MSSQSAAETTSRLITTAHLPYEVNPNKTTTVRALGPVDVTGIKEAILQLPESAWDKAEDYEANYNKGGAIRQAAHVIFKFCDRRQTPFRYVDLPAWQEWEARLMPLMLQAVAPYGYKRGLFPRVMFADLPAGGFIPPHVDGDPSMAVPHKIHIPITTNERTYFFQEDERVHMPVGFAFEVNNAARHSVVNGGDTDRIHLVFEYLDADVQPFDK